MLSWPAMRNRWGSLMPSTEITTLDSNIVPEWASWSAAIRRVFKFLRTTYEWWNYISSRTSRGVLESCVFLSVRALHQGSPNKSKLISGSISYRADVFPTLLQASGTVAAIGSVIPEFIALGKGLTKHTLFRETKVEVDPYGIGSTF
jgi:hypothetical protein